MELILIVALLGLVVVLLILKSLITLLVRYALFVGVAVAYFAYERGPDVQAWLGREEVREIALVAALAMVATTVMVAVIFRKRRLRWLATPVIAVLSTIVATSVLFQ